MQHVCFAAAHALRRASCRPCADPRASRSVFEAPGHMLAWRLEHCDGHVERVDRRLPRDDDWRRSGRGLAGIGVGRCDGPATAERELDRSDLLRARGPFNDSY